MLASYSGGACFTHPEITIRRILRELLYWYTQVNPSTVIQKPSLNDLISLWCTFDVFSLSALL
jgi:hypothetical protein